MATKRIRNKKIRVLPGFKLTLGFTLFYLSLIVLIPLAAVFWKTSTLTWAQFVHTVTSPQALAFAGIHVLSPRLLRRLSEEGAFSIIAAYLRLAGEGARICGFRADGYRWRDLGRPEHVAEAAREIAEGLFPQA